MFNLKYKNIRKFLNSEFDKYIFPHQQNKFKKDFSIAFHYFRNDNMADTDQLLEESFSELSYDVALNLYDDMYSYQMRLNNLLQYDSLNFMYSLHTLRLFMLHFCETFDEVKFEMFDLACCNDCQQICGHDEITSVHDGNSDVCESCLGDYQYVDDAGTHLHIESDEYAEYENGDECNESEFEGVFRWDYETENRLCKQKLTKEPLIARDTLVSGLEIEMEARSDCPYDFPQQITDLFNDEYCMFKGDGSLSHGFEMVTAPCTLDYHKKALDKLFNWNGWRDDDGNTHVKAWNTDTCGLHINLNRKSFSQSEIGKILVFINDDMNSSFIEKISGRNSDGYAQRSPKKISDARNSDYKKYVAVNLTHTTHIELRIFRGNVTKHGILRCLEFSYALAYYVKRCSMRTSSLHYQEFLKWFNNPRIKSQYPYFNEWLVRKDYIKGGNTNRIVTNELNEAIDNVVNG